MSNEIWHRLLLLESRDLVEDTFERIHHRSLNYARGLEIRSAARQAREFFDNSRRSDLSVRPLLTFYGVASLSRSLTLLLRRSGGEGGLTKGHGLETIGWSHILGSDIPKSLSSLGDLRCRTCNGLFSHLIQETRNRICVHVNGSAVDWQLDYDVPPLSQETSLSDLLARIPDLHRDHGEHSCFAGVSAMTYTSQQGFSATVQGANFAHFRREYENNGYQVTPSSTTTYLLKADADTFDSCYPQFMHTYVHKDFGTIPSLNIVRPLGQGVRYSQLGLTYLRSYVLGMLARYFPTHWIALIDGSKGDRLWPTINRLQNYVETTFPELVSELIDNVLSRPFHEPSRE